MLRKSRELVPSLALVLAACGGLDPGAFQKKEPPHEAPVAGWFFDAGAPREAGGAGANARGGSTASGGSGSSRSGAGGSGETADGGEAGAPDGRSGNAPLAGAGGRGDTSGSAGGGAGGTPSGGRAGATTAGRAAGGNGGTGGNGAGGAPRGGQGGRSGAGNSGVAGAGGTASTPVHALYFGEYVEGSSSYKALEIAARAESSLAGCRLVTYFNGSVTGSGIALDGVVTVNAPYVLCSAQLAALLGTACQRSTSLTFNGDDAIALECDGTSLDVIGQIGVDPGDAWTSGDASTLNHTLRRSCPATADPDGSDPFDPSAGWTSLGVDAFDGLGHADCGN